MSAAPRTQPGLLLYCQHSLGMGHLVRSLTLAGALAERFRVVLLNGGSLPDPVVVPEAVQTVALAPLAMGPDGGLVSEDARYSLEQARAMRTRRILDTLAQLDPAVIVVELFPFGRRQFAGEILSLLERARVPGTRPRLVVCSLRDILVRRAEGQQRRDDEACRIANRYFNAVLVHSDPRFARIEETFSPRQPLRTAVAYTGFVSRPRVQPRDLRRQPRVLVSAGGGRVGWPLFQAALEAQPGLWTRDRLKMRLIAGPLLPDTDWEAIRDAARDQPGLEVRRHVPDVWAQLNGAAVSISQCGYNTALEILDAGVPALVVPFARGDENEQLTRALRLERLGALRVLRCEALTGERLARRVRRLLGTRPEPTHLDVGGAAQTARWVWEHAPVKETR